MKQAITPSSLVRVKKNAQVTIPADIRDNLKLTEGDLLEVSTKGHSIVLKPKALIDRDPVIDARIPESMKDMKAGKTIGPFESVEEFEAFRKTKQYKSFLKEE